MPARAQKTRPNELLAGKLIYVDHMPQNLDQWIIDDLRLWGRYKRTANSEGVDLVIEARVPEQSTEYEMRGGIPRPRRGKTEGSGGSAECPRLKPSDPPPVTISVVDWATGERLWYAHLLNKKFKKEENAEMPAGPHTDIYTRGLTPDQVAMKAVTKLRQYVAQLESEAGGKQAAAGSKP
jgi:hypothetical protein